MNQLERRPYLCGRGERVRWDGREGGEERERGGREERDRWRREKGREGERENWVIVIDLETDRTVYKVIFIYVTTIGTHTQVHTHTHTGTHTDTGTHTHRYTHTSRKTHVHTHVHTHLDPDLLMPAAKHLLSLQALQEVLFFLVMTQRPPFLHCPSDDTLLYVRPKNDCGRRRGRGRGRGEGRTRTRSTHREEQWKNNEYNIT